MGSDYRENWKRTTGKNPQPADSDNDLLRRKDGLASVSGNIVGAGGTTVEASGESLVISTSVVQPDTLSGILSNGNETLGSDIIISSGDLLQINDVQIASPSQGSLTIATGGGVALTVAEGKIAGADGTALLPAYTGPNVDTGLYFAPNRILFATQGIQRGSFDAGGGLTSILTNTVITTPFIASNASAALRAGAGIDFRSAGGITVGKVAGARVSADEGETSLFVRTAATLIEAVRIDGSGMDLGTHSILLGSAIAANDIKIRRSASGVLSIEDNEGTNAKLTVASGLFSDGTEANPSVVFEDNSIGLYKGNDRAVGVSSTLEVASFSGIVIKATTGAGVRLRGGSLNSSLSIRTEDNSALAPVTALSLAINQPAGRFIIDGPNSTLGISQNSRIAWTRGSPTDPTALVLSSPSSGVLLINDGDGDGLGAKLVVASGQFDKIVLNIATPTGSLSADISTNVPSGIGASPVEWVEIIVDGNTRFMPVWG